MTGLLYFDKHNCLNKIIKKFSYAELNHMKYFKLVKLFILSYANKILLGYLFKKYK